MRKKKKVWKDQHHIIPRSRAPQLASDPRNITTVDRERHELYHKLFSNRSPDEIIAYLVEYFWGGQWFWIKDTSKKRR